MHASTACRALLNDAIPMEPCRLLYYICNHSRYSNYEKNFFWITGDRNLRLSPRFPGESWEKFAVFLQYVTGKLRDR